MAFHAILEENFLTVQFFMLLFQLCITTLVINTIVVDTVNQRISKCFVSPSRSPSTSSSSPLLSWSPLSWSPRPLRNYQIDKLRKLEAHLHSDLVSVVGHRPANQNYKLSWGHFSSHWSVLLAMGLWIRMIKRHFFSYYETRGVMIF